MHTPSSIGSFILSIMALLKCVHSFRWVARKGMSAVRLFSVDSEFISATKSPCTQLLQKQRTHIRSLPTYVGSWSTEAVWYNTRESMQLDSTALELHYLGKTPQSDEDISRRWNDAINDRVSYLSGSSGKAPPSIPICKYQREADEAVCVVQLAASVIRAMQRQIRTTSISKADATPVTIADLAMQALIIDRLSSAFPSDHFIAEEDSHLVRNNPQIRSDVLAILTTATGTTWNDHRLYVALDSGSSARPSLSTAGASRIWVLDPIDGTKGFLRGEHCCTGLGLLVNGEAVLSVLGCPNVNLRRLLQKSDASVPTMCAVDPPVYKKGDLHLFHPDSGAVFYAVSGEGAFARSLSMPLGAAYEVTTSSVTDVSAALLCESAEAGFGDRAVTSRVRQQLQLRHDYVRIDGMCKHALVGMGAAEATLRLPPAGYREKIWDHVAGDHFVREAGGKVTDLAGRRLDYTAALTGERELRADVEGVVVSNGLLHEQILRAVGEARSKR